MHSKSIPAAPAPIGAVSAPSTSDLPNGVGGAVPPIRRRDLDAIFAQRPDATRRAIEARLNTVRHRVVGLTFGEQLELFFRLNGDTLTKIVCVALSALSVVYFIAELARLLARVLS